MPQFPTIHTWTRADRPFVLMSMTIRDKPFVHSFPRSGLGSCVLTSDPEVCEVATAAHARAYEKDNLVAIPYDVAATMFEAVETERSLRGEIADYQSLIKNASLPHGDKMVKLLLTGETAEDHEGGGFVAFFELEPGYVVAHQSEVDA